MEEHTACVQQIRDLLECVAGCPAGGDLATWTAIPVTALFVLLVPGIGGAWEEPGFRGFALPRLEKRFGAMAGPLVLGVLWVIWHGPLFLVGQILWTDVLVIIAASVVIASVFHTARGSVLVAMIMHATNNAVGGSYASQLFQGADQIRLGILTATAWWLSATVVLVWMQRAEGRRAPGRPAAERRGLAGRQGNTTQPL